MNVVYRKDRKDLQGQAKCWFAKFDRATFDQILDRCIRIQNEIGEASCQGTQSDIQLWDAATETNAKYYGRAEEHNNKPNTLLSALSGIIDKMRRNKNQNDLTEKQLDHLKNIMLVITFIKNEKNWTWIDAGDESSSDLTVKDRLFDWD